MKNPLEEFPDRYTESYITYAVYLKQKTHGCRYVKNLIYCLYLADWDYALKCGKSLTGIKWYCSADGPAIEHDWLNGDPFCLYNMEDIKIPDKEFYNTIDTDKRKSLEKVVKIFNTDTWSDFIRLVYSTYPMATTNRYSEMNLCVLAEEYRNANT